MPVRTWLAHIANRRAELPYPANTSYEHRLGRGSWAGSLTSSSVIGSGLVRADIPTVSGMPGTMVIGWLRLSVKNIRRTDAR